MIVVLDRPAGWETRPGWDSERKGVMFVSCISGVMIGWIVKDRIRVASSRRMVIIRMDGRAQCEVRRMRMRVEGVAMMRWRRMASWLTHDRLWKIWISPAGSKMPDQLGLGSNERG
jgi:hypothetical protein